MRFTRASKFRGRRPVRPVVAGRIHPVAGMPCLRAANPDGQQAVPRLHDGRGMIGRRRGILENEFTFQQRGGRRRHHRSGDQIECEHDHHTGGAEARSAGGRGSAPMLGNPWRSSVHQDTILVSVHAWLFYPLVNDDSSHYDSDGKPAHLPSRHHALSPPKLRAS